MKFVNILIVLMLAVPVSATNAPAESPRQAGKTPIIAVGPDEGVVRWLKPDSAKELGQGFAVINEDQQLVPIKTGSVLYIPLGEWHGLKNTDPQEPMDILLVTTPVKPNGLGDFFQFATVKPGHPPLNLPENEFLKLVRKYGMEVPKTK